MKACRCSYPFSSYRNGLFDTYGFSDQLPPLILNSKTLIDQGGTAQLNVDCPGEPAGMSVIGDGETAVALLT